MSAATGDIAMRAKTSIAFASVLMGAVAALAAPADAACKKFGFTVNDYGKDGPTNDAKNLLDKHITEWAGQNKITDYQTGKKTVSCELFLDVILFDEHTCTASATVCWGADAKKLGAQSAAAPATDESGAGAPPTPVRKAHALGHATQQAAAAAPAATPAAAEASTDAAALPQMDAAPTAPVEKIAAPAEEAPPAAPAVHTEAPAAPSAPQAQAPSAGTTSGASVETGALQTGAMQAGQSLPAGRAAAAAAAASAAAAAERAAVAAETAANAAKEAAAAAVAASAASKGPATVPPLSHASGGTPAHAE
jgi:hypothetical protein